MSAHPRFHFSKCSPVNSLVSCYPVRTVQAIFLSKIQRLPLVERAGKISISFHNTIEAWTKHATFYSKLNRANLNILFPFPFESAIQSDLCLQPSRSFIFC